MPLLWRIYLATLLVTLAEGGMNIIYPPFLQKGSYRVEAIGLLVALFGVMQLASRLPIGALYDARRAKLLFAGCLLLFVISTAGFALGDSALFITALTMLHGFAFGGIGTVTLAWAIELKPPQSSHGAAMGWYTASLSAGYGIGNFAGGYLADHSGYAAAFLALGASALVSLVLALTVPAPTLAPAPRPSRRRTQMDWRTRWRRACAALSPNLALATLIAFYVNYLDDGFFAFFPLFGLSAGLSLTFIGLLKSVRSLVSTGLRPLSGRLFRYVPIGALNNVLLIVWAVVVFLVPSFHSPAAFLAVFALIGVSRGLTRVTSTTMIAEEKAAQTSGIGLASGIYNAGLDVGAFAGPLISGFIASATDIPTMFRITPLALLVVYFTAVLLVGRVQRGRGALVVTARYPSEIRGVVRRGQGRASAFTHLPCVLEQFRDKIGFDPYPGTMNVYVDGGDGLGRWRAQRRFPIQPDMQGLCPAKCLRVSVHLEQPPATNGAVSAAWVTPEVPDYPADLVELMAPVSLRDALGVKDGDRVCIQILEGTE